MRAMGRIAIDWSTARVRGRELTVAFEEATSAAARKHMKALVERLQRPGEPWKAVAVKKDRLIVSEIADGAEEEVRHFLESVVLEADAAADDGAAAAGDEQVDERDRRMTDAFQAFAPDSPRT